MFHGNQPPPGLPCLWPRPCLPDRKCPFQDSCNQQQPPPTAYRAASEHPISDRVPPTASRWTTAQGTLFPESLGPFPDGTLQTPAPLAAVLTTAVFRTNALPRADRIAHVPRSPAISHARPLGGAIPSFSGSGVTHCCVALPPLHERFVFCRCFFFLAVSLPL